MTLRKISGLAALAISALAIADTYVVIHLKSGTTEKISVVATDEMAFTETTLSLKGQQFDVADIDQITLLDEDPQQQQEGIRVVWSEGAAPEVVGVPADVAVAIDGGNVTLTCSNTTEEYTYILSGQSANGSFTLVSDYKSTIRLEGLQLQSSLEEALNIKCGKRVALVVEDGTTNTLSDATADNGQKGAIYCKGHLELSGGGTLNLTGHVKHALSTKEYLQVKKSFGTLNVLSAANDGIHAGQYFQMNGGAVNITGIGGDGIQAEVTDDPEDELNGQMLIKGGTISIKSTAEGRKSLKCDGDFTMTGGSVNIENSGNGCTVDGDTDTAKGISTEGNAYLLGGEITIKMTGTGGKGIKVEGNYEQGVEGGEGPMLSISTSGAQFSSSSTGGGTTGPGGGWGGRPGGGGFGGESSGSSAKAIKVQGLVKIYGGQSEITTTTNGAEGLESKQKVTGSIQILGGQHYFKCYDDCINSAGGIEFNGGTTVCYANGNDAVDSNFGKLGAIVIGNGNVLAYSSKGGAEEGFDCDNNAYIQITGTGCAAGFGGKQGGSGSTNLGSATQGYIVSTSTLSLSTGRYYTLSDASGQNLFTFTLEANLSSTLSVMTATGMKSGSSYTLKYATSAPTDATTAWHGFYLGSSAVGTMQSSSFTAK